ncbi:DUF2637 domain-containing protein [Actinoallomurus sp. NBC_01490]|uniref:DUF2637 domain-containing protein n=1 Tax=Actinoallomurus sp. NBC_01490 TaxID=2903557 RepID=UPI002E305B28|nr:DUF2637 domain-containing protein [Actinoallomurus sp. NBC_01490]
MTITPAQYSKAQRRLLTTLGGLGVAALAAGTFVLSYDDLRLLALRGGAARHWAFLYPGMLDGLVVVIILAILSARRSGWFSRAVRWLLLVILIAGAGAAGVQRAVKGYAVLPDTPIDVGVAVAPWSILILAVWLWIAMIKQVLSRRTRRSRRGEPAEASEPAPAAPAAPSASEAEAVPATVVDGSIIPGLGGETRPLPRPASVRELEPVREPAPPATEENPWEAARLDPEPWEEDTEPVPAASSAEQREPAAWDALSTGSSPETARPPSAEDGPGAWNGFGAPAADESWPPEPGDDGADSSSSGPATGSWKLAEPGEAPPGRAADEPAAGGEASDAEPGGSVPPSWDGGEAAGDDATADQGAEPASPEARDDESEPEDEADEEPAPLLPPLPGRAAAGPERPTGRAASPAVAPAEDATEPESDVEAPVNDTPAQPAEEEPRPRYVARTSLPTDVRLVGPKPRTPLADTQPDGIKLPVTKPDGIPIVTTPPDDEHDTYADERAEDPEAGMESNPPSSKFRSGPTPPRG